MSNAWEFRYGGTSWAGPYTDPQAALSALVDNVALLRAEEDLVVVAALVQGTDAYHSESNLYAQIMLAKATAGWYVRLLRNSPA